MFLNGLEAELDEELGYTKYDYRNKETDNSRNGHSVKNLKTSFGETEIDIGAGVLLRTDPSERPFRKNDSDTPRICDACFSSTSSGVAFALICGGTSAMRLQTVMPSAPLRGEKLWVHGNCRGGAMGGFFISIGVFRFF